MWKNAELIRQFSLRSITQRTRGTVLGMLWQLLYPLLMMGLYTLVFGVIVKGGFSNSEDTSNLAYGLGIYIGLNLLSLINDSIGQSPYLIVSEPNLVKKVVFPLEIIPFSSMTFSVCQSVSGLILACIALVFLGSAPAPGWLLLPVVVLPLIVMATGLAWLISSISVYIRDLSHLTGLITQVIFWTSGIFYSAEMVQQYPGVWDVMKWNPVLLGIDEARKILLWNEALNWTRILYIYGVAIVIWYLGYQVFSGLRKGFADQL